MYTCDVTDAHILAHTTDFFYLFTFCIKLFTENDISYASRIPMMHPFFYSVDWHNTHHVTKWGAVIWKPNQVGQQPTAKSSLPWSRFLPK